MSTIKHISGIIETITFGGFGGPNSGEMIVRIATPNKTIAVADIVSLHLGWANGLSEQDKAALIGRWKTLLDAYANSKTVHISYHDIGLSLPEIVTVTV